MDIEGKVRCGVAKARTRGGLAKTALRASTLTALGLLIALAVLLPNAAAEAQSSPATSTATATATATPTDYDTDDDGFIDIRTLAQLNAVRYDLNGDAKQGTVSAADWAIYTAAFSNPASGMGCKPTDHDDDATTDTQPTCKGYELMRDLDFDTDGDGDVDSSDTYPNWTPIGTAAKPFTSTFKGNSNSAFTSRDAFGVRNAKISNLTISAVSSASPRAGLFGATGENARIEGVGLVDVNIDITTSSNHADIGALVGDNLGDITACYSTGKISAAAGRYSEAGGLVGYNGGEIAAAYSRATVYMSSSNEIYVGGLTGYNGGTVTAAYAAGAVKGKGNNTGKVGGLVGYNVGSINASYSVAPVTSVGPTFINKPEVLGLSFNEPTEGYGTVTASYWDYIASGVPDDADAVSPEGKSTHDLMHYNGIYADWDDLTIGSARDADPWEFFAHATDNGQLPRTYKGHLIIAAGYPVLSYRGLAGLSGDLGNQEFAQLYISHRYDQAMRGNTIHPHEGMTLKTITKWGEKSRGSWMWETSTDGITWTTLVPSPGERFTHTATNSHWLFVPRSEHGDKYIRAKIQLDGGGYGYTRVIGKIKRANNVFQIAGSGSGFASGSDPTRVGRAITGPLPSGVNRTNATALWHRCDSYGAANWQGQGCELVGSLFSYTPVAADVGHHLRAYIYYMKSNGTWVRAFTGFTKPVVPDPAPQWRGHDE